MTIQEYLKKIIHQVVQERKAGVIELEIMPDHVHLLMEVDPHMVLTSEERELRDCLTKYSGKTLLN